LEIEVFWDDTMLTGKHSPRDTCHIPKNVHLHQHCRQNFRRPTILYLHFST